MPEHDDSRTVFSLDGTVTLGEPPRISAFSPAISFALCVFETVRGCSAGADEPHVLVQLGAHLARLRRSAEALSFAPLVDIETLETWTRSAAARLPAGKDIHIRISAFADSEDGRLMSPSRTRIAIKASVRPPGALDDRIRDAVISSWRKPAANASSARIKCAANYVASRMALLEARQNGATAALLLDQDGAVTEGPAASFFAVIDGALITPALSLNILDGLTRRALLDLADRAGIPCREEVFGMKRLARASEAFFCSTGKGIEPVARIGPLHLEPSPGPITRQLDRMLEASSRGT